MRSDSVDRPDYSWNPRRVAAEERRIREEFEARATGRVDDERIRVAAPHYGTRRQGDAVTGSVRSWLLTGTRRIPIDPRRRQGVHEGLKLILTEDEESVDNPSQEISESMKRQAIVEAMNRLPVDESQIIKLAYFGGKTNEEIAESTGIPMHSVRRRLREGLRQMQAHLEATGVIDTARASGRRGLASLVAWLAGRYSIRRRDRTQLWSDIVNSDAPPLLGTAAPAAAVIAIGIVTLTAGAATAGHVHLFNAPRSSPAASAHKKTDPRKHPAATAVKPPGAAQVAGVGAPAAAAGAASQPTPSPVRSFWGGTVSPLVPHGAVSSLAITRSGVIVIGQASGTVTSAAQQAAGAAIGTGASVLPTPIP